MNPEIEELEDILDTILRGVQEALQNGEILSEEFQLQIAQEITLLTQEIDDLYEQNPQDPLEGLGSTPTGDNLTTAMPSSNVEGFAYDDKSGKLLVRFLGDHPNKHGDVYAYGGVPKQIFDLFQKGAVPARTNGSNKWGKWWKGKNPSMGASLHTLIKGGGYPYQKLS